MKNFNWTFLIFWTVAYPLYLWGITELAMWMIGKVAG